MKTLRQVTNSKARLEKGAGGAGGATETFERPLVVREPMRVRVRVRACLVGEACVQSSLPGDPPKGVSG